MRLTMLMVKYKSSMHREWMSKYREIKRGEHSYIMDYHYGDIYNYYKDKFECKVNKAMYSKLCTEFNLLINNEIVVNSFEFKLPYRLGYLRIRANKQIIAFKEDGKLDTKKMSIDWGASHRLWKEQYPDKTYKEIMAIPHKKILIHTNEHSNGYIMRWFWDKRLSNTKNQSVYIFKPVKGGIVDDELYYGKRGLSAWVKNDDKTNEYFE